MFFRHIYKECQVRSEQHPFNGEGTSCHVSKKKIKENQNTLSHN